MVGGNFLVLSESRYDSLIMFYSIRYGVDPKAIKKQIRIESGFNPLAVSFAGAAGLMQFMEQTFREWEDGTAGIQPPPKGVVFTPFDPEESIKAGCAYMAYLIKEFGALTKALAAYNWGPGNLKKLLASTPDTNDWTRYLPDETLKYVIKCSDYSKEILVCH